MTQSENISSDLWVGEDLEFRLKYVFWAISFLTAGSGVKIYIWPIGHYGS
jgi:hypothetical protein